MKKVTSPRQTQPQRPLYVRAHLTFTLDGHRLSYARKNISFFGASGLPWHPLKPRVHFGVPILVEVTLIDEPDAVFTTRAYITREQTAYAQFMGLHFHWTAADAILIRSVIARKGFLPPANKRRFPRIPLLEDVQSYPMRAMVYPKAAAFQATPPPISMDIANLSPGGIMVSTEHSGIFDFKPGQKTSFQLEPRGYFPYTIEGQAVIRRVLDDIQPKSGNQIRFLGLEFSHLEEPYRSAFRQLLKDIVLRIQSGEHGSSLE